MVWTTEARRLYFGETGSGMAREMPLASSHKDGDRAFLENYCSNRIRTMLENEAIAPEVTRKALAWLTALVDHGDHTSPGWDFEQPLILISKGLLQNRERATIVGRKPRLGICIHQGELYVWADKSDVANEAGWVVWRDHGKEVQLRFDTPIQSLADLPEIPENLSAYLGAMSEKLASAKDTPSRIKLLEILQGAKEDLAHPLDFDVVYPRLSELLDDDEGESKPAAKEPVKKVRPAPRPLAQKKAVESHVKAHVRDSLPCRWLSETSMLSLLRKVAIERVRQAIPHFDDQALDHWIMSTGYADAGHPNEKLTDLMFVYAASLTNSGGPKPGFSGFSNLVRDGLTSIFTTSESLCALNVTRIAGACAGIFSEERHAMGGRFADDVSELAAGRPGRPLMALLLNSVVEFVSWLQRRYPDTDNLAAAFSDELSKQPTGNAHEIFDLLHDLTALRSVGVATAANFVKDSQVPAMSAAGVSPRDSKYKMSGWFAKPDLHVMRLMAMITGRCDRTNLQSLNGARARALFLRPPANGFSGEYPGTRYPFTPDMRVVADIHEWARQVGTSPLEIDRILYLIGVKKTMIGKVEISTPYYDVLVAEVRGALTRGVSGKS